MINETPIFSDDECLELLFKARHANSVCPICGRVDKYYRHRLKQCFTCACGSHQIYPRKGTIFENSPLGMSKWFVACQLVCITEGRVTAKKIQDKTGVTYPSALKMKQRIASAYSKGDSLKSLMLR